MPFEDFYETLGVSPTSDEVVIRAAYKALMQKYHPDRNPDPDAANRAKEINAAYETLGDPARRAEYDRQRAAWAWPCGEPAGGEEVPPHFDHVEVPVGSMDLERQTKTAHGRRWWIASAAGFTGLALLWMAVVSSENGAEAETSASTVEPLSDSSSVPDVAESDVSAGFSLFEESFKSGGPAGVAAASRNCRLSLAKNPTWSAADRCAALDFSADGFDKSLYQMGVLPPGTSYGSKLSAGASDLYKDISQLDGDLTLRLQRIETMTRLLLNNTSITLGDIADAGKKEPAPVTSSPRSTLATVKGNCHSLVLDGQDVTSSCVGRVVNAAYGSGKASFTFEVKGKALIGFFGTDHAAEGNEAELTVESITLNLLTGSPPTSMPVSGRCTYTNPYSGPSTIKCTAWEAGRRFEGTFVSDGSPPQVIDL